MDGQSPVLGAMLYKVAEGLVTFTRGLASSSSSAAILGCSICAKARAAAEAVLLLSRGLSRQNS